MPEKMPHPIAVQPLNGRVAFLKMMGFYVAHYSIMPQPSVFAPYVHY